MSFFATALGLERRGAEDPAQPLNWAGLADVVQGTATRAGLRISPDTVMRLSTVYVCVRVLSETVGTLHWHLYHRRADGGKDRAVGRPLYNRIRYEPNPEMTSQELRESLAAHLMLRGMAYGELERNGRGDIEAIWPLHPDYTRLVRKRADGRLWCVTINPQTGQEVGLPPGRYWRIRGFGTDPYQGLSPVAQARESLALAAALEGYAGYFFANNSQPGGVLETERSLSDLAKQNMKESWQEAHGGLEKAHRVAVLEAGVKWKQVGLSNEDAQFLEARKFQRSEIYALFRIPAHMAGDLEHATFSNIEHQKLEFYDAVLPYCERMEGSAHRDMVGEADKGRLFVKHNMAGLVRGDFKTRMEGYALGRQWGWWNVDEIRENEDLNPLPDGKGQIYLEPLNMVPAGSQASATTPSPATTPGKARPGSAQDDAEGD